MTVFSLSDIEQAARRLDGRITRTPLLESAMLNELAQARVFVKAECLQLTGSFKYRGALNKVLAASDAQRAAGFVAFSSGNHGQGVAAAARAVGSPAVIVMPNTAPRVKVQNCRWWGAEVVLYDPQTEDRVEVARRVAAPRGLTLVPPFDDFDIMAGQGTCGLEIVQQLQALGVVPDAVVAGCSGGGLASGVAQAVQSAHPAARIVLAEIEGFEKFGRSLAAGAPQSNPRVPATVMDALTGPVAGVRPLDVLLRAGAQSLGVSDEAALQAVAAAFRTLRIVLEPGGAAALAAVLQRRAEWQGRSLVVIASGGNIDAELFAQAIQRD